MKVLVIEDNSSTLELLKIYLDGEGFEVDIEPDGIQGIAHLGKQKPDAIILDFLMPGMTGIEFLKMIREDPRFSDIPAIITTAAADKDFEEMTAASDALHPLAILRKPYKMQDLVEILHKFWV